MKLWILKSVKTSKQSLPQKFYYLTSSSKITPRFITIIPAKNPASGDKFNRFYKPVHNNHHKKSPAFSCRASKYAILNS